MPLIFGTQSESITAFRDAVAATGRAVALAQHRTQAAAQEVVAVTHTQQRRLEEAEGRGDLLTEPEVKTLQEQAATLTKVVTRITGQLEAPSAAPRAAALVGTLEKVTAALPLLRSRVPEAFNAVVLELLTAALRADGGDISALPHFGRLLPDSDVVAMEHDALRRAFALGSEDHVSTAHPSAVARAVKDPRWARTLADAMLQLPHAVDLREAALRGDVLALKPAASAAIAAYDPAECLPWLRGTVSHVAASLQRCGHGPEVLDQFLTDVYGPLLLAAIDSAWRRFANSAQAFDVLVAGTLYPELAPLSDVARTLVYKVLLGLEVRASKAQGKAQTTAAFVHAAAGKRGGVGAAATSTQLAELIERVAHDRGLACQQSDRRVGGLQMHQLMGDEPPTDPAVERVVSFVIERGHIRAAVHKVGQTVRDEQLRDVPSADALLALAARL